MKTNIKCIAYLLLLPPLLFSVTLWAQTFTQSTLATGLNRPWEMLYGPDNMLWITQSNGRVSRVNPNTGNVTTVYSAGTDFLPSDPSRQVTLGECNTSYQVSSGTYGMALHPDFINQPYIYFIYSFNAGSAQNIQPAFKVRRLTWNTLSQTVTATADIITDLPLDLSHDGMRMILVEEEGTYHFYITAGDGTIDNDGCYPTGNNVNLRAQSWESRFGKTLRYNIDGTIPESNPIPGSPVYSKGHRNALGLAHNPVTGILYSSENGKRSDDELNIIEKSKNYGWPQARGYHNDDNYPNEQNFVNNYIPSASVPGDALKEAIFSWCPTPVTFPEDSYTSTCIVAPSDMIYYNGTGIPAFKNCLLVTTIKNFNGAKASVNVFKLNAAGTGLDASSPNPAIYFKDDGVLRYRDITVSPDGKTIFICTDTWEGIDNKIFKFTYVEVPTVELSIDPAAGSEADGTVVTVTATASAPVSGSQTLDIVVSGTGITAGDYILSNTTITIPNGSTTGSATFTIVDDAIVEGTETAILNLNNFSAGIARGITTWQKVSITDNDFVTFYPRTTATDLSQVSHWTDDISGSNGNSPANFSSPQQNFVINRQTFVAGTWNIAGGSNVILQADSLFFGAGSMLSVGVGSNFDFGGNNGYSTIFRSDATSTFTLAPVSGSISNATNITIERFITASGNRAYRQLTPTVNTSNSIKANWQEGVNNTTLITNLNPKPGYGTHISGSTSGENGLDATLNGNPSLYTLNANGTAWEPVLNTASLLYAQTGYLIYYRGDRSVDLNTNTSSTNGTLRATGSLLWGDISYAVAPNVYNYITNPYASAINWALVYAAGSYANDYVFLDPNKGSQGTYITVQATDGANSGGYDPSVSRLIQSGQAFWVKPATASITIAESHKSSVNNRNNVFRTNDGTIERLQISLFYTSETGRRIADGIATKFGNNYSVNIGQEDATKFSNFDEDVAILRNGVKLSIEGRPLVDQVDTLPIYMARMRQQAYEWQFDPSNFNAPGLQAWLQDKFLNTETQVSLSEQTIVPFAITSNTATSASDRFRIVFRTITVLPINFTTLKAFERGNFDTS